MGFQSLADRALDDDAAPEVIRKQAGNDSYELREVLVQVKDVSLSFGEGDETKVILRPTSVEIRDIHRPGHSQGQVIGLLGKSGVGKTQFSRIVAGLQKPTSGEVLINTFEGALKPVAEGMVGMVAQDYPMLWWRTVMGNLIVAQRHLDIPEKDKVAKAHEYMHLFGMEGHDAKYPRQLSGGQRQRAAIIQQLLSAGHYLVLDEPFTGLDPIVKDKVCETINKVAQLHEHNTIFVVAHDITALCQISDQLWLFGKDKDEAGVEIPGATIKKQFDLIERGLAWQPDLYETPRFSEFVREIRSEFRHL